MVCSLHLRASFTNTQRCLTDFVFLIIMRITIALMVCYLCFLTIQPMVSPVYACEKKVGEKISHRCRDKEQSDGCERQAAGECPASGVCNPFGTCTCCFAAAAPSFFEFTRSTAVFDFNVFISANLLSNYLADCFHPPEQV